MKTHTYLVMTVLLAALATPLAVAATDGIRAAYIADDVPAAPADAAWERAPQQQVALTQQKILPPFGGGSVETVTVRALHDGQQLALRFEWADKSANQQVGVNRFRDAVAVGFPARKSDRMPSPFMGDVENPVNIWQWTADFDANARGRGGFATSYPHTEGVWYFPQDYEVTREVRGWRGTEPVIELVAAGWGTVERKVSQNVYGISDYSSGKWRVVLRRALATGNPEDTQFRAGEQTHVIIAVWNGEGAEVNGKKNVTMSWIPLIVEPTINVSER
jgi:hypothetical protein